MLKDIWKNKFLLVILVLAIWIVPNTISVPEQSRTETIVIAIGIDKMESEYEVSLQYVVPYASVSSNSLEIVSQKDKSVDGAIQKINRQLGKISGFAHCRALVFNEKACEEDLTFIIDSILRKKTNTNNIIVLNTSKSSKDVLSTSNNLDSELYSFLNNSAFSSEYKGYEDLKSVGDFYNSYFGLCKCFRVYVVDAQEDEESSSSSQGGSGGGASSEEGSGSGSSSQGGSKSKKLKNEGKILILKDSKKLVTLTKDESSNLNWFNKTIEKIDFEIDGYSDENVKDADITFHVFNKNTNLAPYFERGVPHMNVNVKLHLRPVQILSKNLTQENYEINEQFLTKKMDDRIKEEVKNKMKTAEQKFKEYGYDVIECEEKFYKFCNKDYKKFIESLNADEDFIKNVVFNYNIEILKGE